jgi:hypothetical protein
MANARTRPAGDNTGEAPTWSDSRIEYNQYGDPTGYRYVRCRGCGVEVLAGDREHATHRDGCPTREVSL